MIHGRRRVLTTVALLHSHIFTFRKLNNVHFLTVPAFVQTEYHKRTFITSRGMSCSRADANIDTRAVTTCHVEHSVESTNTYSAALQHNSEVQDK